MGQKNNVTPDKVVGIIQDGFHNIEIANKNSSAFCFIEEFDTRKQLVEPCLKKPFH
ncbi:hypothetical protein [Prochlorococcus sp. MIT 0603]|uniref:hypothetical protein n=1 Tax=unclassified Prochlorococcus TaxID=2627481 RepID=UPI0005338224|nr:hypothetical protein [Prochlorococcus sp. MIT 0603]KGG14926.1 hypothetical protein EV06_1992 [Prochlorococcus sp. MIT 0602]KGG15641.1 hypothetical protein EV07_1606 [Prochlorococcus sp. MIT 0603]